MCCCLKRLDYVAAPCREWQAAGFSSSNIQQQLVFDRAAFELSPQLSKNLMSSLLDTYGLNSRSSGAPDLDHYWYCSLLDASRHQAPRIASLTPDCARGETQQSLHQPRGTTSLAEEPDTSAKQSRRPSAMKICRLMSRHASSTWPHGGPSGIAGLLRSRSPSATCETPSGLSDLRHRCLEAQAKAVTLHQASWRNGDEPGKHEPTGNPDSSKALNSEQLERPSSVCLPRFGTQRQKPHWCRQVLVYTEVGQCGIQDLVRTALSGVAHTNVCGTATITKLADQNEPRVI